MNFLIMKIKQYKSWMTEGEIHVWRDSNLELVIGKKEDNMRENKGM